MFARNMGSRRLNTLKCRTFSRYLRPVLMGKATTEGTLHFIQNMKTKLHHHFKRANIFVNPIIHGPPKEYMQMKTSEIEINTIKALLKNESNAIFVYDYGYSKDKPWHTDVLSSILNQEGSVKREEIVVFASLGLITDKANINLRLNAAKSSTKLEHIDIAIVEVRHRSIIMNPLTCDE